MAPHSESKTVELLSPVAGRVVGIEEVPDPVFSKKLVGDGFGVSDPPGGAVLAPVSGKVTMSAESKHALGFRTPDGLDVLVHLGIDTVELEGRPFTLHVGKGDEVEAGQEIGRMDVEAIREGGKDSTVILAVTNTPKVLASLEVNPRQVEAGEAAATAGLKEREEAAEAADGRSVASASASASGGEALAGGGAASGGEATAGAAASGDAAGDGDEAAPGGGVATREDSERPADLEGFDALAWDILKHIGGKGNIRSVTHCITRVRFYLKDQAKADDDVVADLDGVIDVVKAGGQYQVVIGPAVEDVYDAVVAQLGEEKASGEQAAGEDDVERPSTAWGWVKHGFSSLIGVITGSMIPVIGLLAASGIIKGILSLLLTFGAITEESQTYAVINAMSDSVFFFLPIFVGFTAARRLGADPIIVAIVGGVLTYPSLVSISETDGQQSILGMSLNAEFFGLPYHMAAYTYSIFPIIVAAWLASILEPWLKKVIPVTVRMIFLPLIEVVVVSLAILLVLGPVVTFLSGGIAAGIQGLYDLSPTVSGLVIGGLYQCLVIFGLHWAVIPLIAQDIAATGSSSLNAIVSATMVAQGGAVLAVFFKSRVQKIKTLSGPAAISAFCGITEPAMYGVNLKYGRVFVMALAGGAVGGFLTGILNVNMWGFTGALVGFTSFVNPEGLDASFWGYLIASGAALTVSFVLTWFFGFKDADVEKARDVKKVRLGRRDPVQK
ncbi:glucose PTS transporter subunit IIA [Rothia sp. AR01]|uniref:Glucose PTS transporter subunit IIA n=1 Tax=Rothia santali TaxID=2949643 RepID=A0A9X2KH93_9MICC|nr:PTS glucose transporter subunit IIABC [Rothia santali]MCP3424943.1 glucose PTS transporter subunit IIA [Rothia santali]